MSTLGNERVAWFNGKIVPEHEVRIPFRDSSWLYGDGAFDMTRSFGGKPFKLREHMERFYRSLKYLRIDPGMERREDDRGQRGRVRAQPPSARPGRGLPGSASASVAA